MKLKDKNVVITGCNRGIGKAILEQVVKNGANVWACVRESTEEFEKYVSDLSNEYQVWIEIVIVDIRDSASIKGVASTIMKSKKQVDILVNNAGISKEGLLPMTSRRMALDMIEVNYLGLLEMCSYISKLMIRQKSGVILNIASYLGFDGNKGQAAYAGSKAAVVGATKSMAIELGEYNIRVNGIAPGMIDTDMTKNILDNEKEKVMNSTCLKRIGKPEEVAKAVVFLASDDASFITNQIIRVDGGII